MDISSLRERRDMDALTVTQLNNTVKSLLENAAPLQRISVLGELSNVNLHTSGHLYFTLKDDESQIKCVMFRSQAMNLKFVPKDGMRVTVSGSVSVYSRGGSYQLYATGMRPDGVGDLYLEFIQLKEKLSAEGLFDAEHKLALPSYPLNIGVITSPTGAAVRDIINVSGRRFPLAHLYLYPSLVQGDGAVDDLIRALDYFEKSKLCDVIIIGRGGGSIEDLWAFNSERLARRIYDMTVPVVSAVGHETDFTICDFVADFRAPTPSAAAEIVTPDAMNAAYYIDDTVQKMHDIMHRRTETLLARLESLCSRPVLTRSEAMLMPHEERLSDAVASLSRAVSLPIDGADKSLGVLAAKMNALSPLSVLARGYSIVENAEGIAVRDAGLIHVGERVSLKLQNGSAEAQITEIRGN